ncbi:IclR family transcriptional regulator [Actinomycetota bacterium]
MSKVPAADNTLRVLSHLASRRGPVAAASIASALGLPRSSVYHLLTVMRERGYVVHYPEDGVYGLGLAAYELSGGYLRQAPIARLGHPLITALVDRVGENAHLATLHGRDVIYVIEERAPGRPSLVSDEGVRLPAHLTATGRAILAALPRPQVRALYPNRGAFATYGAGGSEWTSLRLKAELERTRARGYAVEEDEITPGLSSVAVVARDHLNLPAAAVAVTFEGERRDEAWRREQVAALRAVAATLSTRLHPTRS